MALQYSTAVRNAQLDAFESTTGTSAVLRILTGSPPANCAAGQTGTVLAELTLPSDWMNAASGGTKTLKGTWEDSSADNTGTAGYFRIYDSGVTTCHCQGTVTVTAGGGDMTVASTSITSGQDCVVSSFTLTAGNA